MDNHKINIIGDWRYYKFPTVTYGLGSKNGLKNADTVDYSHVRIYEVVTTKIIDYFTVGAGWNYDYHFNITEKKSENIFTDLDKYNNYMVNKTSVSSGVTLNFQYDSRFNSNNPDEGTYAFLQLRNNLKALGSDGNWQSLMLDARKYIQVSRKSDNVLALWSYNYFTLSGTPPYFDLPSLGEGLFNDVGRSYVQNRYRGLNFVYLEAEYRFRLVKNGFLGGVLFSNASSVTEYPNGKFETINPAIGLGLRIKMDKFSKTNMCLDYSFNIDGSRIFAFQLNEVF
jgi:hypothetical protein